MEVATWMDRIAGTFLKEARPFTNKRDINWRTVKIFSGVTIGVALLVILLLPNTAPERDSFSERGEASSGVRVPFHTDPTQDALVQLQGSGAVAVPGNLDHLYRSAGSGGSGGPGARQNSSMILMRAGGDSRTQLPPSSKILVRLTEGLTLSGHALPVIGVVEKDVAHEDTLAIPQGSKLLGDASFNDGAARASVNFRAIIFPDGRQRALSALGMGLDGEAGVGGNVGSNGVKNTVGKVITRFVGAYAEGSITRSETGVSRGGAENGLRQAIAETAKDQANDFGEDLKKERRWIELSSLVRFHAVLTDGFTFQDPGSTR